MRRSSLQVVSVPLASLSLALLALTLLSACGKIEVRSIRNPGVPQALLGEWEGTWLSSGARGDGSMEVRVQEFAGQPVVTMVIDNPCLVPRAYQLLFTGGGIELRVEGEAVLHATLGPDRTMTGDYGCPLDAGTWSVRWTGDLPPIIDLSGRWEGTAQGPGSAGEELVLDLVQRVQGGSVQLQGTASLPGLLPVPLPIRGVVRFRDGEFDLVLDTTSGVLPILQMAGVGDAATIAVDNGIMLTSGGVLLPFTTAVWEASRGPD